MMSLMACSPSTNVVYSPLLVTSTTRPTGRDLFTFLRIGELDTGRELMYDGTGWVIMSEPMITTFAPVVTSGTGTITTASGTMRYSRRNGYLDYSTTLTITTNGTGATNILFTLPVAPSASIASRGIGYGRESGIAGKSLVAIASGGSGLAFNYDNSYPASSGAVLQLSGSYEMTTRYS